MRAVVFPVLCVCIVLSVPVSVSAQKSRSCGPSAIRAAAARQVAPHLVGCRYDEVAVPLVRYFSIFPVLTKTPGSQATSTILQQSPAAGEPLAAGGQLALSVSVGRSLQPEATNVPVATVPETTLAGVSAPEVPGAEASADPAGPVDLMAFTVDSAAASAQVKAPAVVYLFRPALLWVWAGILAVGIVVALVFRGKRKRSEYGYDRVPKVFARLDYGPGRLSAQGPLVVSRESGQ